MFKETYFKAAFQLFISLKLKDGLVLVQKSIAILEDSS